MYINYSDYASLDNFDADNDSYVDINDRSHLDKWILSRMTDC